MSKPIHAKPSLYAFYFELIKAIGLEYGYNIVLHGSMNRDLDLIAIPWQEVIKDKNEMLEKIADAVGGYVLKQEDEDFERQRKLYHGREAHIININRRITSRFDGLSVLFENNKDPQYYIDISILPTLKEKDAGSAFMGIAANIDINNI